MLGSQAVLDSWLLSGCLSSACCISADAQIHASLILISNCYPLYSFDGDDFDDVEEDEGLDDLENAEEVSVQLVTVYILMCPRSLIH